MTISDVALLINSKLWSGNPVIGKTIVFNSSQTPLIYDPMSTLAFGYASCTGVSIFYVDALRSIGIPARIAGTPAWNSDYTNGNHNWLEVWTGETEGWQFIEAAPAGGGETFINPCDKWFCNSA
jgi:transglutaminase-like putative cysteine protease